MGDLGQALWMVAAVGAALWFVATIMKARGRTAAPPPRTLDPALSQEVRDSLDDIFVRLQDYSRETLAKLDTKIRMLNQLVGEAERREKTLRDLLARIPSDAAPASPPPDPAPTPAAGGADAPGRPVPSPDFAAAPVAPLPDRRREKVCAMADEGRTLREITLATGLQTGEVEMILNLRRMPSA